MFLFFCENLLFFLRKFSRRIFRYRIKNIDLIHCHFLMGIISYTEFSTTHNGSDLQSNRKQKKKKKRRHLPRAGCAARILRGRRSSTTTTPVQRRRLSATRRSGRRCRKSARPGCVLRIQTLRIPRRCSWSPAFPGHLRTSSNTDLEFQEKKTTKTITFF